jgi:hypothetical protein
VKHILNVLDLAIGHLSGLILNAIFFAIIVILGLAQLALLFKLIFEYSVSADDLSKADLICILLFFLVSFRFFFRGIEAKQSYWFLTKRFFYTLAHLTFLLLTLCSLSLLVQYLTTGELDMSVEYEDLYTYSALILVGLTLYAATPLTPFIQFIKFNSFYGPPSPFVEKPDSTFQ